MTFNKKQLIIFLSVTFGIGWLLQAVSVVFYNNSSLTGFRALLAVSMFAPLAGVLISRAPFMELGWKPHLKGNIKYLLIAWFAPFILTIVGAALYFLIFPASFDLSGEYLNASSGQQDALAQLEAQGMTYKTYLIVITFSSLLYAPWVNMLFAIGEEAGWRGLLYPMLKNKTNTLYGNIIGGIIWGLWHFPIITFAGYEYGTNYFGAPFLGIFVFCIFTVFTGITFDYLYSKTRCIWIPALAHGSINAVATITVAVLDLNYMDNMILGPAPVGLISGVPIVIAALLIIMHDNRRHLPADTAVDNQDKTDEIVPAEEAPASPVGQTHEAPVKPFDIIRENDNKAQAKPVNNPAKKSYPKSKGKKKRKKGHK